MALLTFDLPGKGANILATAVLHELAGAPRSAAVAEGSGGSGHQVRQAGHVHRRGRSAGVRRLAECAQERSRRPLPPRASSSFSGCRKCPLSPSRRSTAFASAAGRNWPCGATAASCRTIPRREIGFPEVKLGLYPGWGGTVRAPRIVGLASAVEMITSGETIDARAASHGPGQRRRAAPISLLAAAIGLIRAEQAIRRSSAATASAGAGRCRSNQTELGFLGATASAIIQQETKGQYPAPLPPWS